ncbi:MAG: BamA/TamA family outer membrane protein [Desulfobacterales bacterium]|nr:BamA/TamA family outer membrane protein [Desulfobacterales bacterium]
MSRADCVKKILALALFLLVVIPKVLSAYDGDFQFKIRNVDFSGVKSVETENFSELLTVQSPPAWKIWIPHNVAAIEDLEEDLLKIKQYYRTQGYYHAQVSYSMKLSRPAPVRRTDIQQNSHSDSFQAAASPVDFLDEYHITFEVKEGSPVIVRNIDVNYIPDEIIVDVAQLKEALPLKIEKTFRTEDYDDAKAVIKQILRDNSYPFAEVKGRAKVDLNHNSADISFDVIPGDSYYFGKLNISGHEDFMSPTVVERAMRFRPGDKFSAEKISESRVNLFDLNVFQTASIETGEPNTADKIVPVNVSVKPRKRQGVGLGVGYGTEDKLRLQGGWGFRNLTGNADRISIKAKRSDLTENISGEYQYPYFLSARNNLIADSGFEREKSDYYTVRNVYSRVNVYRKLTSFWTSNVGYNLEVNRPEDIKVGYVDEDINDTNDENFRVSSVLVGIERNTLDDDLNPTRGTVLTVSFETAGETIWSEISYIKPVTEAKFFYPVVNDLVLGTRVRFITIQEVYDTDDIPIYRQLFLGGSKTVRGYDYQKLGVIDENDELVSVGGQSSFVGSTELRYPFYKDFSGVTFLDMGVMDTDAYRCEFDNMRYTCGMGLRYDTVIGPIQMDVGYKLNPPDKTDADDSDTTEQADTDRWKFYFSIGHAF